jgi:pimeloyl-ACP methyl ester carboxylesterase
VYTPTLTGLGERAHLLSPDIDLDTHIQDVTALLEYEDLTEVILGGHSYGGMVITGVADRALARIRELVYLDAAIPRDGQSLVDLAPDLMAEARRQARVVDGVELVLFPDSDAIRYYGVTDPDDLEWMEAKLTPHPWRSFEQRVRLPNETAVNKLPRTNINCTPTLRMRPNRPDSVLEADRVWEIDTGHDLMITEPQAVAEMLSRLAPL